MFGLVRRIVPYLLAGAKNRLPGMTSITHAPLPGNAVGAPGPAANLNDHVDKPAEQQPATDDKVDDSTSNIDTIVKEVDNLATKGHVTPTAILSDAQWDGILEDRLRGRPRGRRMVSPRPRTELDQLRPVGGSADYDRYDDWLQQYRFAKSKRTYKDAKKRAEENKKRRAQEQEEQDAETLALIEQTISRLDESEAAKADKTAVDKLKEELTKKADKAAVVELEGQMPLKADKADVDELKEKLSKKADKADLDNLERSFASFGKRADKAENDAALANTKIDDLAEKVKQIQLDQGTMNTAIDANMQTGNELRGRFSILEKQPSTGQVNMTNSGVILAAIPSAEQPQSKTDGCDAKKVKDLDAKTKRHDRRLEQLETAVGDFNVKVAAETFSEVDAIYLKEIERLDKAIAEQKKSFDQQMEQQKKDSDEELSDCKASIKKMVESQESFRKEYEDRLASKDKKLALKEKEIASKDKELALKNKALASKNTEFDEYMRKNDADQKVQNERHNELQNTVNSILAQLKALTVTTQQPPAPVQAQQPPKAHPSQLPPPSLGNGTWGSAPVPPNNGQQPVPSPDVEMGGLPEPDHEMMDAPPQLPQLPRLPQPLQPLHQPLQQPPFFQPRPQPPKPSFAAQDDTPMAFGDPMVPSNNGNAGGFVLNPQPKPKPAGVNLPFPGTAPAHSPLQSPTPSAAPAQGSHGTPTGTRAERSKRNLFGSSSPAPNTPGQQKPLADPAAPSAQGPAPFNFATPLSTGSTLPDVNTPMMDWSAPAGKLNFAAPPSLDDDDGIMALRPKTNVPPVSAPPPSLDDEDGIMALRPKANVPPVNAAPSAPPAGQPAANNAPRGNVGDLDIPMANGSSSAPGAPSPAPAKPSTPQPAKKKADPFVKRKPGATPSQQKEVTSKAQTTQTKASSIAQRRQAIFAGGFNSELDPTYTVPPPSAPASPKQPLPTIHDPSEVAGAGNESPFASKPKAPAPKSGFRAFTPAAKPVIPLGPIYNPSPVSYKPVTPSTKPPRSSPLANHATTSDMIESPTAANVFIKEPEKPAEQPPEATGSPAPEESMGDAGDAAPGATGPEPPANDAQGPQPGNPMETDHRRIAKPKKNSQKLTAAQIKSATDSFLEMCARDAKEKAAELDHKQKLKAEAAAADDEVDYADPNDMNDEDTHVTTMAPPKPEVRKTKYSFGYFCDWKDDFLTTNHLAEQAALVHCITKDDLDYFIKGVQEEDDEATMDYLLHLSELPIGSVSFKACEMEKLMNTWREEVFFKALTDMDLDDLATPIFESIRKPLVTAVATWFNTHDPDVE